MGRFFIGWVCNFPSRAQKTAKNISTISSVGHVAVCGASSGASVCNSALISRTGNSYQAGPAQHWCLYPEAWESLPACTALTELCEARWDMKSSVVFWQTKKLFGCFNSLWSHWAYSKGQYQDVCSSAATPAHCTFVLHMLTCMLYFFKGFWPEF